MKNNNFKIKALETMSGWVTKGQVYEFKNGQTRWDDGCKSGEYNDYKELEKYLSCDIKFKEYGNTNESIIIYKKDNDVIAIKKENGQTVKSAKAKCYQNDDFDFEIGAKLAFDRLLKKSEEKQIHKKEPYLKLVNWDLKDYGKVGKPTIYKDECDKPLFVGDKVLTISNRTGDYSEAFVVSDENKDFIMGIHSNCNEDTGAISYWRIVKIQDFSKTQNGDEIEGIKCVMS